jgi:alcohol dehydrogenase, propanol-preferring
MRAAIVSGFTEPLTIEDRPIPTPGPGEILVRIEASGLCHTDIHAARGEWPVKPSPPFVPGHEGVGIVTQIGPDVTEVTVGDRVAVPWLGWACGVCEYCVSGWETLCLSQKNTGYGRDGGFAEYVVATAKYVGMVPAGIDPFDAAPLTCAGVTTFKAVKVSGVGPADLCAVFGVGGLGHLAVQYAQIAGAQVAAVDIHHSKLNLAKELGATYLIDASREDPAQRIQELGGADAAIVLAANPESIANAYKSLKRGGRLVLVGLPKDNLFQLPIFETVLQGITVIGSIVGTRQDLRDVFELHAQGRTRVVKEVRRLDDVNSCIEAVLEGSVDARIVFDLRSSVAATG